MCTAAKGNRQHCAEDATNKPRALGRPPTLSSAHPACPPGALGSGPSTNPPASETGPPSLVLSTPDHSTPPLDSLRRHCLSLAGTQAAAAAAAASSRWPFGTSWRESCRAVHLSSGNPASSSVRGAPPQQGQRRRARDTEGGWMAWAGRCDNERWTEPCSHHLFSPSCRGTPVSPVASSCKKRHIHTYNSVAAADS